MVRAARPALLRAAHAPWPAAPIQRCGILSRSLPARSRLEGPRLIPITATRIPRLSAVLLLAVLPAGLAVGQTIGRPAEFPSADPMARFPDRPKSEFPGSEQDGPERGGCNVPGFSLNAGLANDNRRTTGLVLAEGGFGPPVQRSLLAARLHNIQCRKVDGEIAVSYSLHDARLFEEKVFMARGMFEPLARVRVYGGIAYVDNPEGLFRPHSAYLMGGIEYPTVWGATLEADFIRDVKQHGDWATLQLTKRHRLGASRHGAAFYYRHGLGATGTRHLPGNSGTESITGVPSVFYRSLLEIADGPVTWYFEVSPHVSFVSRATGVRKHHLLVAAGMRMDFP